MFCILLFALALADEPMPDPEEYVRVEVKGTLLKQDKEYVVRSQDRLWKLKLGKDRVILFLVANLENEPVIVTGMLTVDTKLDTITVSRLEPVKTPEKKP